MSLFTQGGATVPPVVQTQTAAPPPPPQPPPNAPPLVQTRWNKVKPWILGGLAILVLVAMLIWAGKGLWTNETPAVSDAKIKELVEQRLKDAHPPGATTPDRSSTPVVPVEKKVQKVIIHVHKQGHIGSKDGWSESVCPAGLREKLSNGDYMGDYVDRDLVNYQRCMYAQHAYLWPVQTRSFSQLLCSSPLASVGK